jgi:AsmA-like protein
MKKILIRVLVVLVILVVLIVVGIGLFLDSGIKRGVEAVGPMLTKVNVKLDSVSVSLLSGSGKVKGLVVGNPEGFKSPSAIQVGTASLSLQPGSLLSDKLVIKSVNVQAPEITFETDLKGNNLSKILANVESATGGTSTSEKPKEPAQAKASKKLQVDEFVLTGGKIHVALTTLGGKSATVPLPEIRLADLGKGPEGITAAELTKLVLQAIEKSAAQAASGAVADLSKQAAEITKDATKSAGDSVNKATKGIGDLFKKK